MISERLSSFLSEHRNIVLYFFIGVSAAAVDYGVFYVLFNFADFSSVLATALSIGTATIYGFFINAKYNFKTSDKLALRFISYSAVSGIGMLFSIGFLYVFNVRMGFDGNIMKFLSLPFIFFIQYSLNRAVSFRNFLK